jgi:hypothetical protein
MAKEGVGIFRPTENAIAPAQLSQLGFLSRPIRLFACKMIVVAVFRAQAELRSQSLFRGTIVKRSRSLTNPKIGRWL